MGLYKYGCMRSYSRAMLYGFVQVWVYEVIQQNHVIKFVQVWVYEAKQ